MTALRRVLDWQSPMVVLPSDPKLTIASRRVSAVLGDVSGHVSSSDAKASFETVYSTWREFQDLALCPRRDVYQAPWYFMSESDPRADDDDFARAYGTLAAQRSRVLRSLIGSFLTGHPSQWRTFDTWCDSIRSGLDAAHRGPMGLWLDAERRYGLFRREAPKELAALWLTCAPDLEALYRQLNLHGAMREGRFLAAGAAATLAVLRKHLENRDCDARRIDDLCRIVLSADGRARFAFSGPLARTLLGPFEDRMPEPEVRDTVVRIVTRAVSDPRVSPTPWQGLEGEARVMRRLLADQNIEFFFELLGQTAGRPEHWSERRRFWDRYRAAGLVDDARVALGPAAEQLARRREPEMLANCGRFLGDPDRTHSILIMRIGRAVVVEGSHNMKVRVWSVEQRTAPSLQGRDFFRHKIVRDGLAQHETAHVGNWQWRVSRYLDLVR